MTAPARDGRDGPFSDWLRKCKELDSRHQSLDVTDIDFTFHKYRSEVDRIGTRDVKLMMDVEVKTFRRKPSPQQKETLYFKDQLLREASGRRKYMSSFLNAEVAVWHFGHFVLMLSGDRPENSDTMAWYVFGQDAMAHPTMIDMPWLIRILNFEMDPRKPRKKLTLRRHHCTTVVEYLDDSGLFPVPREVNRKS